MNPRERYRAVISFLEPDRPFLQGEGMWPETLSSWRGEGWDGRPIDQTFEIDRVLQVGISVGPWPPFERVIYEETPEEIVYLDPDGLVRREYRGDRGWSSMPQFLRYPVITEGDFDKLARTRLAPNPVKRLPRNWNRRVKQWSRRDHPLMYFMGRWGGFFGPLRNLLGLRGLCRAFHERPDFVEKMMDQRVDVILAMLERVTRDVDLDAFGFWEDMAYRNGPLLAPEMFEEFMVPRYEIVCEFLRSRGVDLVCVDSDGDVRTLIPLWLKAGLNGIWPLEVQAGMDVVGLRGIYGKKLVMIGGIDKRVLARDHLAIEDEIERVWPVVEGGGYIPCTDHSIPPDVSWDNYRYYREYVSDRAGVETS